MLSSGKSRKNESSISQINNNIKSNSNCEYCHCLCSSRSNNSSNNPKDKNNNSKKKKRKTKKSMKPSAKFTRDCVILKDISVECPEDNEGNLITNNTVPNELWPSTSAGELCVSMQNLCLSPRIQNAYNKIPIHDQKILNRMAKNRRRQAVLTENAWLAQKFWENEKYERELAKCEQELEYRNIIKQKQIHDSYITQARMEAITKRQQEELQKLQNDLYIRDLRLEDRLKKIKLQRNIAKCEKSENELKKAESVLRMLEQQQFHDELIKNDIYSSLKCRLSRAENRKRRYMDAHMRRIKHDNFMEQVFHDANYKETQKFEKLKTEELKEKIQEKNVRTKKFVEHRLRNYRDIVERAKLSASLRDLVRRSVSPDCLYSSRQRPYYDRPSSILSFQSCIKFG